MENIECLQNCVNNLRDLVVKTILDGDIHLVQKDHTGWYRSEIVIKEFSIYQKSKFRFSVNPQLHLVSSFNDLLPDLLFDEYKNEIIDAIVKAYNSMNGAEKEVIINYYENEIKKLKEN